MDSLSIPRREVEKRDPTTIRIVRISPHIFEAFLKCPTKCWLRSTGEAQLGSTYAQWATTRSDAYCADGIKQLVAERSSGEHAVATTIENLRTTAWRLAIDVQAQASNLETRIAAIERLPSAGRGKAAQIIPIRFVCANKLGRHEKHLLAFDALALSETLGREVLVGKIIHGDDHATVKVKLATLVRDVQKLVEKTAALLANPAPPDLMLNRHCAECEF